MAGWPPPVWLSEGTRVQTGCRSGRLRPEESNDLLDRLRALDADELLLQPAVEVGQMVRVEPHLVENGRVQVLDVVAVRDAGAAQLVRLADSETALDAAARQPHRAAE